MQKDQKKNKIIMVRRIKIKNYRNASSLSSQAYNLFSEGKTPLEVAIALNLKESEATKLYREYWKLKQLHNLNMVYEDLKGDIDPFLKLEISYEKRYGCQASY